MRAFGQMWMDDGQGSKHREGSGALAAMNAATAAGYVLGTELRACGVDFSFTPVLDLDRSEERTSELQSPCNLVCRLLLEKKKKHKELMYRERWRLKERTQVHYSTNKH